MKWILTCYALMVVFHLNAQTGQQQALLNGAEPIEWTEYPPQFEGGKDSLHAFIGRHVKYPAAARANGIQGKVMVRFVVDIDSLAKRISISQGIGGGCDEEALRLVEKMNAEKKWIPGKSPNGQPYPIVWTFPVNFTLQSSIPHGLKRK